PGPAGPSYAVSRGVLTRSSRSSPSSRRASTPAPLRQIGEVLIRAGNRRNDLLVGGSLLHGVHEHVEAGIVRGTAEQTPVEALNRVLQTFLAAEDGRGNLAPSGSPPQGLGKRVRAGRIDSAVEHILVEGGQEAGVGAAAAVLEVLRRAGDARFHLLHRVALLQELQPEGQAARLRGAVQEPLVRLLHQAGLELRRV